MEGAVRLERLDLGRVGHFRFKRFGGRFLLTNDFGNFVFLSPAAFAAFVEGRFADIAPETVQELEEKGMVRDRMYLPRLINKFAAKNFCGAGPDLHIVVVTLRCTHRCVYCHAGAAGTGEAGVDMTPATARKTLDKIFETPNKRIMIEFQGGEPLLNFEVVRLMVLEALEKNRTAKKDLRFSVVTNLWPMTDAILDFLVRHGVQICTSLDGPASVHDRQRPLLNGLPTHGRTVAWLRKIGKRYARAKGHRLLGALVTLTRYSLRDPEKIVEAYRSAGLDNIQLRPMNPFGISTEAWEAYHCPADAYLKFYRRTLDYILGLNRKGVTFTERYAAIFLSKIFMGSDPAFLDLRSPCGAGIGQLAYNYDGSVYTCDEGRMLGRRGDLSFRIADIDAFSIPRLGESDVVRAACTASCLDVVPGCAECVYKPYCGTCPVYNHFTRGTIFGRTPYLCKIHGGILDILFGKLTDPGTETILLGWVGMTKTGSLVPRKGRNKAREKDKQKVFSKGEV